MNIQITGNIVGTSGYAIHTKSLANALSKIANVKLKCQIPPGYEKELSDKELDMIKKQFKPDYNIIIDIPTNWRLHTEKCKNIGFLVWEGSNVPKSFVDECLNDEIDIIFVPSQHTKKALIDTMTDMDDTLMGNKQIKVIPHGVDLNKFFPTEKPKEFTFIVNKGFRNLEDRGGTQYAIKAFLEEFKKGEAKMIVKINPAYPTFDLKSKAMELGLKVDSPELIVNAENIRDSEMHKLYNLGHVFVSPTRAEGYNLPCIEAMACGLPVITSNFGGQTDYVNEKNGWLIGGDLIEVDWELMYEGIKWLTPNLEALKKAMRESFNTYTDKVEDALKTARENTWDKTAQLILSCLE